MTDHTSFEIKNREMQRRHHDQIAIRGKRVSLEEGAGERENLVSVAGERALIEPLRERQGLGISQQKVQGAQRPNVTTYYEETQGQGRRQDQADRTQSALQKIAATTTDSGERPVV